MAPMDRWSTVHCQDDETRFEDVISGYKKYQVLHAAIEFGLFDYLQEHGPVNREEISQSLGIKGMLTRSFLQVLTEMGLVSQQDTYYSSTGVAEKLFAPDKYSPQGKWFKYSGIQNPNWKNLKEALATATIEAAVSQPAPGKEFIDDLARRSLCGEVQAILQAVTGWYGFRQAKSVLDIGGGHALVSIALCQENEGLSATVADKPYVDQYISAYRMDGRIRDLGLDVPLESIGGEYDIVILSHFLYKHRKNLEFAFNNVYRLLKPGGLFIANHWFCEIGCGPEESGIAALDKAFLSFGHPLCHVDTFPRFFAGEGFSLVSEQDIPSLYACSRLHTALKPQQTVAATAAEERKHSNGCCD